MLAPLLLYSTIFVNARIITLTEAKPVATVLAVEKENIVYVGDNFGAAKQAVSDVPHIIDAGGRTILPGFNDAHVHFGLSETLGAESSIDLPEMNLATFRRQLTQMARKRPAGEWMFVKIRQFPERLRRALDLDFVAQPLLVASQHGGLLNSAGWARSQLTLGQAPEGFVRGRELAVALERILKTFPARLLEQDARRFLRTLAQNGITSVQLIDDLAGLFRSLEKNGELTARVRTIALGHQFSSAFVVPQENRPADSWVQQTGIKFFHDDGALLPRHEIDDIVRFTADHSSQVVVHVLSQGALGSLLDELVRDAKRTNIPVTGRFRLEHLDQVNFATAHRIAELNFPVCSNPSMLAEWGATDAFPLHTLLRANVNVCLGSDWVGKHLPERLLSPWSGIQAAVMRPGHSAAERISVTEALAAYTHGSAQAEAAAEKKGSLTVGKWADLIVVSEDPLGLSPDKLHQVKTLLTMVGGKIVYHDAAFSLGSDAPPPASIGPVPVKPPSSIGRPRPEPH